MIGEQTFIRRSKTSAQRRDEAAVGIQAAAILVPAAGVQRDAHSVRQGCRRRRQLRVNDDALAVQAAHHPDHAVRQAVDEGGRAAAQGRVALAQLDQGAEVGECGVVEA